MEKDTWYMRLLKIVGRLTPYFVIFALVCFILFFRDCSLKAPKDSVKIVSDTVYVYRTIKIPAVQQTMETKKPEAVKETKVGNDTIRTYRKTYKDSTGTAEVTVSDSVNGRLLNQIVDIKVKEREVKYRERFINTKTTIEHKPSFVISAGLTATSGINPSFGAEIGFKNRNGLNLEVGYNNRNEIQVGIKKDIFTFYNKNK